MIGCIQVESKGGGLTLSRFVWLRRLNTTPLGFGICRRLLCYHCCQVSLILGSNPVTQRAYGLPPLGNGIHPASGMTAIRSQNFCLIPKEVREMELCGKIAPLLGYDCGHDCGRKCAV
eukprot:scaffold142169_cov34-Prasinocladus_malaysianus.AAC.1